MKQKISYSSIASGVSIAIFVAFVAIFVLFWVFINKPFDNVFFWILVGLFCLCCLSFIGFTPSSVDADDDYVGVNRPFHTKRFRMKDIKSVEAYNGEDYSGFEGRSTLNGKYKNPVIITLKDGRKYIIGSENPKELVDYLNSRIS